MASSHLRIAARLYVSGPKLFHCTGEIIQTYTPFYLCHQPVMRDAAGVTLRHL